MSKMFLKKTEFLDAACKVWGISDRDAPSFAKLMEFARLLGIETVDSVCHVKERPDHLSWKGEGPEPASWFAPDGTKVYRSYADYVMD